MRKAYSPCLTRWVRPCECVSGSERGCVEDHLPCVGCNCWWAGRLESRCWQNFGFRTRSCSPLCLLSGSVFILLSLCQPGILPTLSIRHPSFSELIINLSLSLCLSRSPLWLPNTVSTSERNLLSLSHNAARQPQFSYFLTWMLMSALSRKTPGCRNTASEQRTLPEFTSIVIRTWD